MVEFKISRILNGVETTINLSDEQMGLIYDALNDYPQWNDDEDDNPTSVIMSKLYNLLEFHDPLAESNALDCSLCEATEGDEDSFSNLDK